ncbi:MAG: RluA family pseudouridine synthase [Myxococcales bacterium]|nr:RluA family pseudouridine synthase [Myxococcales bacterium]
MPHRTPKILADEAGLLALFKPAGWNTFPGPGDGETLSGWLLHRIPELAGVGPTSAPALLHRLDRPTSGLMLAARTPELYRALRQAFSEGAVEKRYLALVEGELPSPVFCDAPLGERYRRSKKVQVVSPAARRRVRRPRKARTEIEPLCSAGGFTLCRVQIHTGVRHQIRAHLAHLGHPVAGDALYGARQILPGLENRIFLHANAARLVHPADERPRTFSCPAGEDLRRILESLGFPPLTPDG